MKRLAPHVEYLPFALVAVAMAAILVIVLIRLARPPAPPLAYTQFEYPPERSVYAPGETLVYTPSLRVLRPGALTIRRGWRIRPSGQIATLCDGTTPPIVVSEPPPFPPGAVGMGINRRVSVEVPVLPPGDYWLVSSALKADGGEALTQVAITITRACPDDGG